jgi:hypothetical protein
MNDMGEGCYPSTKRITELASLSERSVCTHIEEARQAGWIFSQVHGFSAQGWARNEYRPAWPKGTELGAGLEKGTEPHAEGTEPDDIKALKEVQSIVSPIEHPSKNISIKPKKEKSNGTTRGQRLEQYLEGHEQLPAEWEQWSRSQFGWKNAKPWDVWANFIDYWRAAPGAKGVKADWPATRRNWCRREAQRGGASGRGQGYSGESKMSAVARSVLAERLRATGLDCSTPRTDAREPEWDTGGFDEGTPLVVSEK